MFEENIFHNNQNIMNAEQQQSQSSSKKQTMMSASKNIFDTSSIKQNIFKNMADRDAHLKVGFDQNSKLFWILQNNHNTISFHEYLEEMFPNIPSCECKVQNIKNADNIKIIQMDNKRQNFALVFDEKQCYFYPLFNKNFSTQRFTIIENKSSEQIVSISDVLNILSLHVIFAISNYGNIYFIQICKQSMTMTSKRVNSSNESIFGKLKSMISFGTQLTDERAKVRCIHSQRLTTGCFLEMCSFFNGKFSFYSLVLDYNQGELRIQNSKETYSGILADLLNNHERLNQNLNQGGQQQTGTGQQVQIQKHMIDLLDFQLQYIDEELSIDCLTSLTPSSSEQSLLLFEIKLKKKCAEIISYPLKELSERSPTNFYGKIYDPTQKLSTLYYIIYNEEFQVVGSLIRKDSELGHSTHYVDDNINGLGGMAKGMSTTGIYLIGQEEGLTEINQILNIVQDNIFNNMNGEQLDEKKIQEQNSYIVPAGCNPDIFFNLLGIFQQNIRIEDKISSLNMYLKNQQHKHVIETLYMISQEMKKEKTRNIVLAVSCKENDRRKSNQKFNQEEIFSIDNDIILYEINKKLHKLNHFKQFVERSELKSNPLFSKVINSCIEGILKAFIAQQIRQIQIQGFSRKDLFEEIFTQVLNDQNVQDENQQKSIDRIYINLDNIEYIFNVLNQILISSILKSPLTNDDLSIYFQIWTDSINVIIEGRQQINLKRLEDQNNNIYENIKPFEDRLVDIAIEFMEKSLELFKGKNISQKFANELKTISNFCLKETVPRNITNIKNKIVKLLIDNDLLKEIFDLCLENKLQQELFDIYFQYNYDLNQLKEYLKVNNNIVQSFILQMVKYEKYQYSENNQEVSKFRLFNDFPEFIDDINAVLSQYYPNLFVLNQILTRPISKLNNISYSEATPTNPYNSECLTLFRAMQRNINHLKQQENPQKSIDSNSQESLYVRRLQLMHAYQLPLYDYLRLIDLILNSNSCNHLNQFELVLSQVLSNFSQQRMCLFKDFNQIYIIQIDNANQKINDLVELYNIEKYNKDCELTNIIVLESAMVSILRVYQDIKAYSDEYNFLLSALVEIIESAQFNSNQFFQKLSEAPNIALSREIRVKLFEDIVQAINFK